jgi:ABC-type transporter Mla subunit MlaD
VIGQLDKELRASLGRTELLRRAVQECGQANAAIGAQLRTLSRHMSRKQKATPIVKTTLDNSGKLQKLAGKLTKTLEDTRGLRDNLRAARNELGAARDDAARAHAETAELRDELRRAGAARAEAVLEPLVGHIRAMQPHIDAVTTALHHYRESLNWKNWHPQRAGTDLYTALEPVYRQLGITATSNTPASNAPPEIQAILAAVAGRFAAALPDTLERSLEALHRHLQTLSETVRASLRAVERVPGVAGGGRKTRRHRAQRTRRSR